MIAGRTRAKNAAQSAKPFGAWTNDAKIDKTQANWASCKRKNDFSFSNSPDNTDKLSRMFGFLMLFFIFFKVFIENIQTLLKSVNKSQSTLYKSINTPIVKKEKEGKSMNYVKIVFPHSKIRGISDFAFFGHMRKNPEEVP